MSAQEGNVSINVKGREKIGVKKILPWIAKELKRLGKKRESILKQKRVKDKPHFKQAAHLLERK